MTFQETYADIFAIRGSRYDQAMRKHPFVREEEFQQIILRANLNKNEIIADVPAGGGYLKNFLPANLKPKEHEPCSDFNAHSILPDDKNTLLPLPWESGSIDTVFSLAGVHHMDIKKSFFKEVYRVLKPEGSFVLSDVSENSSVANFLDEYIGSTNSTGHDGVYLNEQTLIDIKNSHLKIQTKEQVDFHWNFDDLKHMASFCQELFDIVKGTKQDTIEAINKYLTTTQLENGNIGMKWSLMTIVSKKEINTISGKEYA